MKLLSASTRELSLDAVGEWTKVQVRPLAVNAAPPWVTRGSGVTCVAAHATDAEHTGLRRTPVCTGNGGGAAQSLAHQARGAQHKIAHQAPAPGAADLSFVERGARIERDLVLSAVM